MKKNKKRALVIMKSIMFICLIFTVCSCRDTKRILTGGSYQYWHYIDSKLNKDEIRHPYFCREDSFFFYLDYKGTYIEFRANNSFREYDSYTVLHYFYEPSWQILDRNLIRFGRFKYNVISVSDTRILIHNEIDPELAIDTLELIPRLHVPKEYQGFQRPFQFKQQRKERKGHSFFIL